STCGRRPSRTTSSATAPRWAGSCSRSSRSSPSSTGGWSPAATEPTVPASHGARGPAMAADDRTISNAGLAIGSGSRLARIGVQVALVLGVLISMFPFYWLVVMASGTTQDILQFPPKLVPGTRLLHNMGEVIHRIDFFGSL